MNQPKLNNIEDLIESENFKIPIYQRNFDWGAGEIIQLIKDIENNNTDKNYYIGTLVVYEKTDGTLEVIDGQQRLTALYVIIEALEKDKNIKLTYESRPKSNMTLENIKEANKQNESYDTNIINAYEIAKKELNKINIEEFAKNFCEQTKILLVKVPQDTDLNKYFEIMNTRGVQLESHEIIKARCMENLKPYEREMFNKIWVACSNMDKYVQYGLSSAYKKDDKGKSERAIIFGDDWNKFNENIKFFSNYKWKVGKKISYIKTKTSYIIKNKISEIIATETANDINNKSDNYESERFESIINFPNFLLNVLQVFAYQKESKKDVSLNDKKFIETFNEFFEEKYDAQSVKEFAIFLLKCRFLFDKHVIKKETRRDDWSLKYLHKDSKNQFYKNTFEDKTNKKIELLLSMFHVSYPNQNYKYWLSGVLNFLTDENQDIKYYESFLEQMAKRFLYHRYLLDGELKRYEELIFSDKSDELDTFNCGDIQKDNLDKGTGIENFIFNYLDYLLWKDENYNKYKKNFKFTFRSSVEHYYPQNPINDSDKLKDDVLDNFGNLCLISKSNNSKLSNYMPSAKKDHYSKNSITESIKQKVMMSFEKWGSAEIQNHSKEMRDILLKSLKYNPNIP